MKSIEQDTISAIATAPGKAGVGIVRVSGAKAFTIAEKILGFPPKRRYAHFGPFLNRLGEKIDEGIALYFAGPHSFTGEDVFELQGHGGTVVMDMLLQRTVELGARLARPGEFSERAFLNDKIDLVQAEAIADLIDSESVQAAQCALRSLQGGFSQEVNKLLDEMIHLRMYVEAAIDFPEEEIDFLADGKVQHDLEQLIDQVRAVQKKANQGAILRDGMNVVIAGRPNAGKSSLLNALAEKESAIVTSVEGTTRDVLREHILIDGMPLHIIDTAGLRESPDEVEQIGIERAIREINDADRVLLVVDGAQSQTMDMDSIWPEIAAELPDLSKVSIIRNKIDQLGVDPGLDMTGEHPVINISAKQLQGIDVLREHLKQCMGYNASTEGSFTARRRHLTALEETLSALQNAKDQLLGFGAGELVAEDLRNAQQHLGEITGTFSSDDLLDHIFSSFCIGK
ncbi:GTPase required for 5-methylaminomethyl-2-thiouridine modification at tRNA U34 [Oleiphilus messinensis]|uniref:tRNA modification GTPase MnmE n=1 Tax=Oleiphilus messinensis TaxID=141451 RepID=A0A1Y0IHN4_9GAMM|nr:tRNA uridine-5-carboxymethylaminomethyl(34) synthesis GTPase MnmE [Oleiphilus messinensis]ARU59609.1 GTPase required for 5-methylaminomethyl-2-thiouridine modification at tRNA U34 [Oleiphilus messinensis]